jgi:hypothetical protein
MPKFVYPLVKLRKGTSSVGLRAAPLDLRFSTTNELYSHFDDEAMRIKSVSAGAPEAAEPPVPSASFAVALPISQ